METLESKPRVSFEVEKIIGISSEGNYQVQWAPAWVSRFHLIGCEHLIQEFLQNESQNVQGTREIQTLHPNLSQQTFGISDVQDSLSFSTSDAVDLCKKPELLPNTLPTTTKEVGSDICHKDEVPQTELDSLEGNANVTVFFESNEMHHEYGEEFEVSDVEKSIKIEENEQEKLISCTSSSLFTTTAENNISLEAGGYDNDTSTADYPVTPGHVTTFAAVCDLETDINDTETHSERNYVCHYCNANFSEKRALNEHLLVHTGKDGFLCKHCDKTFDRKSLLQQHLRSHTSERPFACSYCDWTFTNNTNLRHHSRTHTGEKPFTCDECGKAFTQKSNLVAHIRSHTGVKPYSCERCGRAFAYSNHRNQHFRRCASRANSNC